MAENRNQCWRDRNDSSWVDSFCLHSKGLDCDWRKLLDGAINGNAIRVSF
ncbi:unnamed protein product [Caenorhabditis brenneri]